VVFSLLHAVGLPELVTYDLVDYEKLALELATRPMALGSVRKKLSHNLLAAPLFDTDRYRKNIEAAYQAMMDIHRRGEGARSIAVESGV
jgi:predicted O-linked N-acetylglucosamine transferase (SPINDLY family)